MRRSTLSKLLVFALMGVTAGCGPSEPAQDAAAGERVVNVYSARHYDVDETIYQKFTEATGIKVELLEGDSAGLLERLRREEGDSPADVFIAVDAGRLYQAETDGIFEAATSPLLFERVPANLRHAEGLWYGITKRARIIVYAKDRVDPTAITRYEDLADPAWRGKVLIRSSSNVYNQSLMASMIAALGEEGAEEWCRGLVANFAREPQGGDRDQVNAVAAGEGDLAVVNTYYLAQMAAGDEEQRAAASSVGVIFPNQQDRGAHVNISGAGVVSGAAHRDQAIAFLEFLTGPEAQAAFATANKEYPIVSSYQWAPELVAFGQFEEDALPIAAIGENAQSALMVMDRCGWR